MRRAMICVSVMLAVLQVWPFLFGRGTPSMVAVAAPAHPNAVVMAVPVARRAPVAMAPRGTAGAVLPPVATVDPPGSVRLVAGESCSRRYRQARASCTSGGSCQVRATDDRDLCDAIGLWPS